LHFISLFLIVGIASAATWDAYVIRNSAGGSPMINSSGSTIEFIIAESSQKAGLGTNNVSGYKIGDLSAI
jgi:hypothetical protein